MCMRVYIRAHCLYTPHVLHPLISQCTLRFTLYLGYCKCAAMNIGVRLSFLIVFIVFRYIRGGVVIL